jgi:L-fuculose-phosphate aldolase
VTPKDVRGAVVEAAREMLRIGLVAGTSGNVSARDGESVVITPARLAYDAMTEDDLVELGPDGDPEPSRGSDPLEGLREPSSERRVHMEIYSARPDVAAIVHTHSVHATAWSFLDEPRDTGTVVERQAQLAWLLRSARTGEVPGNRIGEQS